MVGLLKFIFRVSFFKEIITLVKKTVR